MKPHSLSLLVLGGVLMHGQPLLADEVGTGDSGLLQALKFSGSVRAGAWSSSMNLDDRKDISSGALWLKSEPRLGEGVSLVAEGWVMSDRDKLDTTHSNKLREGYLSLSTGNTDMRIGKQIIVWGRADKLNPTDNISPRDYTLLMAEDEDQRFGNYAAKATYTSSEWTVTGIWLPEFTPNTLPVPHQPGIDFRENRPRGQGGALKLEQTGADIDWSVSYFNGLDLNPDLSFSSVTSSGVNLLLDHHRIQTLGADAATVVGRYALRAEAAYTRTEDGDGHDPFIKNPFFHLVAGGDRTFFEYLNVNLQYYARLVSRYQDPAAETNPALRSVTISQAVLSNQMDRFQHGMTFRISNKWLQETLEGEIAGITSFTRRDYVLKPKLVYSINDQWKGTLGANLYRGEDNAFYGRLRDNSAVFAEIKYGF